jgi:peptide/nickel transport system substrate-binding protein
MRYKEKNVELLVNGGADIIWGLDESALPALQEMASQGVSYSSGKSGVNELLVLNLADPKYDAPTDAAINPHPILSDARVRQAIQYGIDKGSFIGALLPESVQVSHSVMPSSVSGCPEPAGTYDPEKARALLEEAGWKPGVDGIREKEGLRLSMKFTTETGSNLRLKIQEAIVSQMKAIGVELVVENLPPEEFNASWKAGGIRRHGRFDILLVDSGQGATPGVSLKRQFHSARIPTAYNQGEGANISRYHSPEVDDWIDQALGSTSSQQQEELFCQIIERVNQDLPVIPLYEHLMVNAYLSRLQNFAVSTGPANFTYGSQDWWFRP